MKRPVDPIFDIDTALQTKQTNIKAENVIALSETAKALEKVNLLSRDLFQYK